MAEESQDESQKTEDPTQKRLDESRQKGQIASSKEINNWFILLGGAILVFMLAPGMMHDLKGLLGHYISFSHDYMAAPGATGAMLGRLIRQVALIMLVPLGILAVLAALSSIIQHQPVFALESIKPKFEKISPAKGVKRLFSSRSLVEFVKGILKLCIVGTVATLVVLPEFDRITQLPMMDTAGLIDFVWTLSGWLIIAVLSVMTVIAGLDFTYQKMQHIKQLRMSRQDIKDEMKQSEGDPQVRGRLRQIRRERAQRRMMQAVPQASVIVANPTHYSVALKYELNQMAAPVVVAKGIDAVALRIREIAEEHRIPIVRNAPLARALHAGVEIGEEIPTEHFKAVAEIIGYVLRLKGKLPGRPRRTAG